MKRLGKPFYSILLLVHMVLGTVICLMALDFRAQRHADAQDRQAVRVQEEQQRDAVLRRLAVTEARLQGLQRDDPYVIELIARERLGYAANPNEIIPPRQP